MRHPCSSENRTELGAAGALPSQPQERRLPIARKEIKRLELFPLPDAMQINIPEGVSCIAPHDCHLPGLG